MTYDGLVVMFARAKACGISQKRISQETKISQQRISLITRGKAEPTKGELEKFAVYFNCGLDNLVEVNRNEF